jgi:RNA-binding protein Musashi
MSQESNTNNTVEHRLWIGGIHDSITLKQLKEYFSQFGTVLDAFMLTGKANPNTGKKGKPFAFIMFDSAEAITSVMNHGKHFIDDIGIDVRPAEPRSKPRQINKTVQSFHHQGVHRSAYQNRRHSPYKAAEHNKNYQQPQPQQYPAHLESGASQETPQPSFVATPEQQQLYFFHLQQQFQQQQQAQWLHMQQQYMMQQQQQQNTDPSKEASSFDIHFIDNLQIPAEFYDQATTIINNSQI